MKADIRLHIALLSLFVSLACTNENLTTDTTLYELVALRTEGLALAELVGQQTGDDKIDGTVRQIKAYYRETHPTFLNVCAGQPLVLREQDFDTIWNTLQAQLFADEGAVYDRFLSLYIINTEKSITIYQRVLSEGRPQELYHFAKLALPNLYNQQKELCALLKQKETESKIISPLSGERTN